jgi:hypothetical protein
MRRATLLVLLAWSWVETTSATAADQLLTVPFHESFQDKALDPLWEREVSSRGSLAVNAGGIDFEASTHARAHVRRQLGVDRVTLTAKVVRWASFYVVWDPDNWVGVGQVSPTPFGRLTSTAVAGGKAVELDHLGIHFPTPRWVRIQIGTNYVRCLYSGDGKEWIELRTLERPAEFAGAPKLIAAGKPYDAADRPFARDSEAARDDDGRMAGRVVELHVEATPRGDLSLTEAELEALRRPKVEPVNALLTRSEDDPTFEKIVTHYPAMKFPREVVGVPAHPLDIGVDRLGRLDVSPWTPPLAWFEVGDPPLPLGREGVPFSRRLLHGYLPVLTLSTNRDGVDYELTVFGWSEGFSVDKDLFAYARLTARTSGDRGLPRQLSLVWDNGRKRQTWPSAAGQWFLRFKYPQPDTATEIDPAEFLAKSEEVRSFWTKHLAPADRFDVPDARVNEAYRAWLVYSMLNADTVNGYVEPHDGAGFYEEMFGCSVSLHARALDQYGFHEDAARILGTQLHYQQPDGLYTQACGLTDPGSLLVALAEHYRMTGDADWLRRVSPNIIKQCAWFVKQRDVAPKDGKLRGIIKFRPYNDYQYPVFNYLGNAWCARGMETAASAMRAIGLSEGETYAEEAAKYRKDVLDSMEATAITDQGQTIMPMEPDTHRLLKLSKYRGGDYYGLVASSLLETEFLPPHDKRTTWIVDMLEKRGGLIAGVSEFQGGIDHAYTYGYLMNAMRREEVRKTLLGFWSMFAFGMTRDTYSPVEVTQITSGENHFTLPHLYSCTDQLRLLRNLLLREEDGVLWLGQGIPRAWLEPGKHVAVNAAPTEFGAVSYRIDADADGSLRVRIDPPSRRTPAEIKLRLRHPGRRPIVSAKATPDVALESSDETVLLRDLKIPIDLTVRFQPGS